MTGVSLRPVHLADGSSFVRNSMEDILTEKGFKVQTVQTETGVDYFYGRKIAYWK